MAVIAKTSHSTAETRFDGAAGIDFAYRRFATATLDDQVTTASGAARMCGIPDSCMSRCAISSSARAMLPGVHLLRGRGSNQARGVGRGHGFGWNCDSAPRT
jgi:hypothetical protein